VSFAAITLCVASERVFIVVSVYFVIDSVRKLFDTPPYIRTEYKGLKSMTSELHNFKSRDSSVAIALGYGLDNRGSRVRFLAGAVNFSLHHRVQNGSGAHPASYPMGTRGSFPGGKAAGA
jgi:hypothetical protein